MIKDPIKVVGLTLAVSVVASVLTHHNGYEALAGWIDRGQIGLGVLAIVILVMRKRGNI